MGLNFNAQKKHHKQVKKKITALLEKRLEKTILEK